MTTAETGVGRGTRRVLVVAATFELLTVTVLLVNLARVHERSITQTVGPLHGIVYLVVVTLVLFARGLRPIARILGCLPVLGGVAALLAARRSDDHRSDGRRR